MRRPLILAAVLALGACAPDSAEVRMQSVYMTSNNMRVVPSADPASFEVLSNAGSGGPNFFCAAADYAYYRLNAANNARVVLRAPVGPSVANPGGRSAFFDVVPQGSVPETDGFTINMRRAGENFSVTHALAFCPPILGNLFGSTWG
ncbi:hypothetical protein [Pseudoruegeria sp. SK021]|uniref:hypothetical protein n=1 Tax=Pseudoruegeria sp. SK021 TaxID=1933035 RepID=UPI000A226B84|nr:hypothetical protein [Pseudoruegeria sp. SK021]OSP55487.1 hypothetical protein BV911_07545 [Pseudoruegeria sp. SK021]